MVLNFSPAPGGKASVALHAGFNPHGLVVFDTKTHEAVQRIPLKVRLARNGVESGRRRKSLDSRFYTTNSMLSSIELPLGLPPMSRYDAAANPMYKTLGTGQDLIPLTHRKPEYDVNEIIWKNVRAPSPRCRFRCIASTSGAEVLRAPERRERRQS